jgi:protocatechuate 3,4-dioxygenase beta subunit
MGIHEEVRLSRLRVSRRRALSLGGTVGLTGLLAACGSDSQNGASPASSSSARPAPVGTLAPGTPASAEVLTALAAAKTCTMSQEETAGPYWFDVDSIRSDIRDGRPGTVLALALRVQNMTACSTGGQATPIANSVVEIWHCDAGGIYSGFESGSRGQGGPGGGPGGSGGTSDGAYSKGDRESKTTDDGTYLRGAQVADASGIVQFTTIFPGWYRGRTTHIHLKVHVDKKTVLTSQLFMDDKQSDEIYRAAPYSSHSGRDTHNSNDGIYDPSGLMTLQKQGSGYLGVINLGVTT